MVVAFCSTPAWDPRMADRDLPVSSARPSNRACGSPAHGSPTPFTAGIRRSPPDPVGSGCDNDPVEIDQAELVVRLEGNNRPAERPGPVMTFSDHQSKTFQRVFPDLVIIMGRVAVAVVLGPPS